jgi:hypothetical protein
MKQIKRTVLRFVVLHPLNSYPENMELAHLVEECDTGAFVGGNLGVVSEETLAGFKAIDEAACALGSEGGFFCEEDEED